MNLEQAMAAVARTLDPELAPADLNGLVRERLLTLTRSGSIPAALKDVAVWLASELEGDGDRAGQLYQRMLRITIERVGGETVARAERGEHRASGAYYTEAGIGRYMATRAGLYADRPERLVDPACGSGALLAAARSAFGPSVHLTGVDTDRTALALTHARLPDAETIAADALLDDVGSDYDVCLGNPPYISSGLRGSVPQDVDRAAALRKRYPLSAQYKLNTYPLFIERGLELVRPGGVVGYILPDSFLTGRYFAAVRALLLQHTLLELTLIRQDFWEHGRVGQSVILFVRKGGPAGPDHHVHVRVVNDAFELEELPPAEAVALTDLVWGPFRRFRLLTDPAQRAFVRAFESAPLVQPLGSFLQTYSGLIGRQGQASLLRSTDPNRQGPWGRLLRSGREIDRYTLRWQGEEVCLDPALIKSGGNLAFYRAPKLLLRQTSDALRAVYDDQGFFCLNNIHLLVPRRPEADLRSLLAVINAESVNRYYRLVTMESGRLYAQVDLDVLEQVPVPVLDHRQQHELAALARKRESAASAEAALVEAEIDRLVAGLYKSREW